jgi:hypothetical protein
MPTPQSKVDEKGRVAVFDLKVPLALALGWYEDLTDDQLREHIRDLLAEVRRRNA